MARSRGFELFGHPLDVNQMLFADSGNATTTEAPEPSAAPEPEREPLAFLAEDGRPSLKRYCELVTPAWNWEWAHLRAIDELLDKVTRGEIRRLIIELPTRIGKTEKSTVRYPAMRLEENPKTNIMVTGYNEKFAMRLSRKIKRIVRGRVPLSTEKKGSADWETTEGGGVQAAGVGVGIAGLPADLIMIDDPTKNRQDAYSQAHRDMVWEWYVEDIYTRLEPTGAIVLTMARRHEDDLVGRILASEDAANWTVLRLPALAEPDDPLGRPEGAALCPDRYDEAHYARMRKVQGEAAFNAMQQQRPAPASGLIFKADWIHYYTTVDHPIVENGFAVPYLPAAFTAELQSWDMTFKDNKGSDFVAGHVWKRLKANCYLIARKHDRLDFPATIRAVRELTRLYPTAKRKLVEDKANGPAVIATLKHEITGLVAVDPSEVGDKIARAHSVTHMWEAGNVWLPHPAIAPWVKGFIMEHLQFPFGTHDDDVDAGAQALAEFQSQIDLEEKRAEFEKRRQGSTSIVNTRM